MATATPSVNLDPNFTKGSSSTYRDLVQDAFGGRLAEGDPLAASYNHGTWGGQDQTHHLLASNVVNDPDIKLFLGQLRDATLGAHGGPYVWDINNPGNLANLPTTNAVRGTNTSISAALHNGNSAEHAAFDAFTKSVLIKIADQYNDAILGLSPADTQARQALALKAAAQVEDFQQTLRGGLYGTNANDIKYFVNLNDDILVNRYAAQGYGSKTAEQRRIFLEQNVYNEAPATLVSQGDVLRQTLPDGRQGTRFLTEEAVDRFLNDANDQRLVNGIPKEKLLAWRNEVAAELMQKTPGLTAEQANAKALSYVKEASNGAWLNQYFENRAPNGTEKAFGTTLDTTPEGIERQKGALAFLKEVASHPGVQFAGKMLGVVGVMVMAAEVQAAVNEGDTAKAKRIAAEWAAEEAGGWLVGGLAVLGVGAAATFLGVPAGVAAVLTLTAGLLAGYVGGEATKAILNAGLDALGSGIDMETVKNAVTGANNGNDLGLDYTQPATPSPTHTPTFDLTVNPVTLNPGAAAGIGVTSGGQGILGAGLGYAYTMPSQYVDGNGLANTAGSALATNMTRPGNHSIHDLEAQINALRASSYGVPQMIETQITFDGVPVPGVSSQHHNDITQGGAIFAGTVFYDIQGRVLFIRPDAGQNVTVSLYGGKTVVLDGSQDVVLSPNQITDGNGSFRAHGWYLQDPQEVGMQIAIGGALRTTPYTDPLTLDSGNDGVKLSASPVSFDLNADGVAESLPWTAPTDPLLVMDVNGNGRIDNGTELVDLTGTGAPLNLLTLDDNADGTLDAKDAAYWQLEIWSDRNQDGYASAEERQSLSDLGIVSIDLANRQSGTVAGRDNVKGVVASSSQISADYPSAANDTLWRKFA